tara:strand:+ start:307 stop:945 length:639 start_codon:yes stop_codon:yes gene_type:complete
MAFTFTTLKAAIQDYTESNETTFVSNLPSIITQAEERILKAVQLPDFRKNVTGTTTQGNQYLQTPSDFLATYSLSIDNSGYEFLIRKDVNFIREAYPSSAVTGIPKHYALFNEDTFILGPTPNAAFSSELHYFYEPQSITVSSDGTSWLGDNAENALLYGCLIEAYTFLKGDAELMQVYSARYETALEDLKQLAEGYNTTDSYRAGSVRAMR